MPKLSPHLRGEELIRELNRILDDHGDRLDHALLKDKNGDVDLGKRRLRNVAKTKESHDVPTREELVQKGMYVTQRGEHVANSVLIAPHGIRSRVLAKEDHDLVPLVQLKEMIGNNTGPGGGGGGGGGGNAVVTTNVDQSVNGYKSFMGLVLANTSATAVSGINAAVTLALSTGPLGTFIRLHGPLAAFSIAGFRRYIGPSGVGGISGQLIVVHNSTAFTMTLLNESTGADTANRILTPGAVNINVRRKGSIALVYSSGDSRWVCVSFA